MIFLKVLITGGAGFIGYHLTKLLVSSDYQIVIVDNFSRGIYDEFFQDLIKNKNVEFHRINLLNPTEINQLDKDFDYIYHLAAIIGVKNVLKNPYLVLRNNVEILFNMVDFVKKQQALKRFIFASTSEVYAGTLEKYGMDIPTPETTPLALTSLENPRTSYTFSKLYGEGILQQSGIPFTIVRPHNFYGPRMGMAHVIPELLKKAYFAQSGDTLEVFSVEHSRTFCYISDAVQMLKLLAENINTENQTYNVGNETPEITIKNLAEKILEITGRKMEILPQPATLGSPVRRCPSMKKAQEIINYQSKISLLEGIQKTFDWYRDNIFNKNGRCSV